jgi:hypothetical protein
VIVAHGLQTVKCYQATVSTAEVSEKGLLRME